MKKLFLVILVLAFNISLFSQDIYSPTSDLTDSEKDKIEDAKKDIVRADRMTANANNDYQKYKNLLTSDKKSKQKKGEKKTVQSKRNLLTAGTYFSKGYEALYNLYSEKLSTIIFKFPEDQQSADEYKTKADKLFADGSSMLSKHGSYSDKDLKKSVQFKTLQTDIITGSQLEKESVQNLAKALELYDLQEKKQDDLNQKDNEAWQNAVMENSITGFETYIDNYPNGLHIYEAEQKIQELEEKIRIAETQQNNPELIYHIQILADTKQWSDQKIKSKIYYTNEKISENYIDGWYKYWIGSYDSYDEAKEAVKKVKIKRKSAFVVGTVNGELVEILDALNVEENK